MTGLEDFMHRLPNDIGGQPSPAFARLEHQLAPWEKRCHALADVLDYHKLISTEEKRRGVEALGSQVIDRLSYYERWATAFAILLFQKGVITPTALAETMAAIESRWPHRTSTAAS